MVLYPVNIFVAFILQIFTVIKDIIIRGMLDDLEVQDKLEKMSMEEVIMVKDNKKCNFKNEYENLLYFFTALPVITMLPKNQYRS